MELSYPLEQGENPNLQVSSPCLKSSSSLRKTYVNPWCLFMTFMCDDEGFLCTITSETCLGGVEVGTYDAWTLKNKQRIVSYCIWYLSFYM